LRGVTPVNPPLGTGAQRWHGQRPATASSLADQKRIVAKVESLLALCDALAAGVVQAEEVRAWLLQAVLNGQAEQ